MRLPAIAELLVVVDIVLNIFLRGNNIDRNPLGHQHGTDFDTVPPNCRYTLSRSWLRHLSKQATGVIEPAGRMRAASKTDYPCKMPASQSVDAVRSRHQELRCFRHLRDQLRFGLCTAARGFPEGVSDRLEVESNVLQRAP